MVKTLHESIVYSEDFSLVNSPAFYDCAVHVLCTAGAGTFAYGDRPFAIRAGEIAVISRPRMVDRIVPGADMRCQYIAAPYRFIRNLLPPNNYSIQGGVSLFENPIIKVSPEDAERFRADLANIRARVDDTGHHFYAELMGALLQAMVYDLFDFHSRANDNVLTTDRVGYITSRFFTLIEAGWPRTRREVAAYAAELSVTPKYLSDTVRRVTGASASAHIVRASAAIAMDYLRQGRMSVSQVADAMGFSSLSYFSRFCSKHLGMTPSQARTAGVKTPFPNIC